MEGPRNRPAQIDLLRRLSPIELFALSERCRGKTSSEIGAALDVTDETAMMYLGNVYDKLGVTYQHVGTSMGRLMAFCPVLQDIDAPPIPVRSEINPHAEPPPHHPSERSLDLVEDDDQAIRAQRGEGGMVPPANRGWLYGLAAIAAILLIAILALIFLLAEDEDDDADATATSLAAVPTATEAAAPSPTPGETAAEDATATEAATATPEPSPTEEPTATATPEPTETPEPTATQTPESTPTQAEPTATPPPEPTPLPQPQPGEESFAADWSVGPGDWELPDGWIVDEEMLIGEGPDAQPAIAPFEPEDANYAIEAVMTVENVDNCNELAGLFGRINPQGPEDDPYPAGYVGGVCEDEWRIHAVSEQENELDELAAGELELDDQPHTYRLEIVGDLIRLFVDSEFIGEATDDRYADPGQVGLFLEGDIRATVEEFRVFQLEAP